MKFILTLTFAALISFGYAQSGASSALVSFSKANYSIQYPDNWTLDTSKGNGIECFLFSPYENSDDKFRENVNVIIQDLTDQQIDLEKYKDITEKQIDQMATEGKIDESVIVKSDKGEYYKITYGMTQGKLKLKIISYCYISNDKAYLITFGSLADTFEQYKQTGITILNSFRVIK